MFKHTISPVDFNTNGRHNLFTQFILFADQSFILTWLGNSVKEEMWFSLNSSVVPLIWF